MLEVGEISVKGLLDIEWSIKDFLSLPIPVYVFHNSPKFSFGNMSWCLSICPNEGHMISKDEKISVYLSKESSGPSITMEYTLGMKTTDGKLEPAYHITHVFDRCAYGVPNMLRRSELLKRKSDLLPSGTLTLVCQMKHPEFKEFSSLSGAVTTKCSYCNKTLDDEEAIQSHLQECEDLLMKCRKCSEGELKNWFDHKCQITEAEGLSGTVCSYCNKTLDGEEDIQSHLQECDDFPIKCRKCSEGVALKNWFDHKCQMTEAEGLSGTVTTKCSFCNKTLDDEEGIQSHLQECEDFPIKCQKCSEGVALKNWFDHKCQMTEAEGTESRAGCSKDFLEIKVLQDYKELFLKQKECDVIIRVKGQEFTAHKSILTARSSVFESNFRNDMKERETGVVYIEDSDPSSFSDFLCFLYCGDTGTLSEENVFSLFTTADKYDVQDLRDICLRFMKENISIDTFCDTITLALQHCETELITVATDFFAKNARKIAKTVRWQKFSADNATQSNELFIKALDAAVGPNE